MVRASRARVRLHDHQRFQFVVAQHRLNGPIPAEVLHDLSHR